MKDKEIPQEVQDALESENSTDDNDRTSYYASKKWKDPVKKLAKLLGKTQEQNLQLLRDLHQFTGIGGRVVIGTSRKSFLARILGSSETPMEEREPGTVASNLWAFSKGASVYSR